MLITFRRFSLHPLLMLAALLAVIAGVFPSPAHAASPGTVTITFTQEPDTLNPMYTDQYFAGLARGLFLEGAWTYDDRLNLVPRLAREIPSVANGGVSKDGTTITVRLREDAKWSDGQPITADDFIFTARMYAETRNAARGRLPYDEAEVSAPNKATVVARFKAPYALWPSTLWSSILPAHILQPIFDKDGTLDRADWNRTPTVGSGAFTLKEYQKGQSLLFVRNDSYFGPKAKLDQILIKIVPDDAAQVAALRAGTSDFGIFLAAADALDLQKNAQVTIQTTPSGYNEGWFFNLNKETGHPALQDLKVRQALNDAINREALVSTLFGNLVKPAVSFWDSSPFQDPALKAPIFDPIKARTLLDEAGWQVGTDGTREKDGKTLRLRYVISQKDVRKAAQQIIQKQLREVGVDVELISYPSRSFLASYVQEGPIARGQFDIAEWSASPSFPDPNTNRFRTSQIGTKDNNFTGLNWSHVSDPALDTLFEDQQKTADIEARTQLFYQISRLTTDNVYWLPLWQDPDLWGVSRRVTGVRLSGGAPFWNASEWDAR